MKDYSMTEEEKKSFICNLKFVGKEIRVYLADGSKEIHPNNREELISIFERMKQQVMGADEFLKNQKKYYRRYLRISIFSSALIILLMVAGFPVWGSLSLSDKFILFTYMLLIGIVIPGSIDNLIDCKRNIDDVMKHRLYLENMDILNNSLSLDLSKVSEPTKELLTDGIDINKVGKIKKRELEYIVGDRPKGRIRRRF